MKPSLRRLFSAAVLMLLTTATVSGCGSSNPLGGGAVSGDLKSVVVGSADFSNDTAATEIYTLSVHAARPV